MEITLLIDAILFGLCVLLIKCGPKEKEEETTEEWKFHKKLSDPKKEVV